MALAFSLLFFSTAILAPPADVSVQSEELGGPAVKGTGLARPPAAVAPVAPMKNHDLEAFEILVRWEFEELGAEKWRGTKRFAALQGKVDPVLDFP